MTSDDKPKRGMFSRLFGRDKTPVNEDAALPEAASPETISPDAALSGEAAEVRNAPGVGLQQDAVPSEASHVTDAPQSAPTPEPEALDQSKLEPAAEPVLQVTPELIQDPAPDPVPQPVPVAEPAPDIAGEPKRGWFARLKSGLSRSSSKLTTGIAEVFTKRRLDGAMLEDLEDLLIQSDLGVEPAMEITEALRASRYDKDISADEVKAFLAGEVEARLQPVAVPLSIPDTPRPYVILVVGVNGSGKTTTIGKLAARFRTEGKSVMLAAGDTFRAAAIDQLKIWGERVGAPVIARDVGADAAGLVFDAHDQATEQGADILMIDTAGRLQNKADLMAELEKVVRVLDKKEPGAPHAVLLVLDATVGQNAISQTTIFGEIAGVTGLIMTKLDGTARGGILVALAAKFGLPVHAIGVGEQVDDLQAFSAQDFARAIAGTAGESGDDL